MQDQKKVLPSADQLHKGKGGGGKGGANGSKKQLIMLLCMVLVAGLAVGGYYFSGMFKPAVPEKTPTVDTSKQLFTHLTTDFKQATIAQLGGESFTIAKTEVDGKATYAIEGMPSFTVDPAKGINYSTQLSSLRATKTADEAPVDLSVYGLKNPSVTATATFSDGTSETVKVGDDTPTGGYVYVQVANDPAVYIAGSYALSALKGTLANLHTLPKFALNVEQPSHILIERPNQATIEMGEAPQITTLGISAFKVLQPVVYDMNSETGTELFTAAMSVAVIGYATSTDDAVQYGFDPYVAKITVRDVQGATMTYAIGTSRDDTTTYIKVDDTDDIYYTNTASINFAKTATVAKYIDTFAGLVNITSVDAMKITVPGSAYSVRIERQPDLNEDGTQKLNAAKQPQTIDTYIFDDQTVDEALFKKLYQDVIGLLADGMMDEANFHVTGTPVYSIEYTLNKEPHTFRVDYIPFGKDYYAISRDGQTLFYIRTEKLDALAVSLKAFHEGTYVAKKY